MHRDGGQGQGRRTRRSKSSETQQKGCFHVIVLVSCLAISLLLRKHLYQFNLLPLLKLNCCFLSYPFYTSYFPLPGWGMDWLFRFISPFIADLYNMGQ